MGNSIEWFGCNLPTQKKPRNQPLRSFKHIPYHPCMAYLPTFCWFLREMQVNVPFAPWMRHGYPKKQRFPNRFTHVYTLPIFWLKSHQERTGRRCLELSWALGWRNFDVFFSKTNEWIPKFMEVWKMFFSFPKIGLFRFHASFRRCNQLEDALEKVSPFVFWSFLVSNLCSWHKHGFSMELGLFTISGLVARSFTISF